MAAARPQHQAKPLTKIIGAVVDVKKFFSTATH